HVLEAKGAPICTKCGGSVKPDVVLYEEGLDDTVIRGAVDAISKADTLIIGGTSLVVYPAAGLINYFKGKNLVLINKSSTSADSKADLVTCAFVLLASTALFAVLAFEIEFSKLLLAVLAAAVEFSNPVFNVFPLTISISSPVFNVDPLAIEVFNSFLISTASLIFSKKSLV
ncbi:Sir2 family NAD-dependent protein deacetylase, partial [Clostridium beijerinckii]|uniref:Sir2 family NAD-dependent protein deacetylase n=1 Tax=Clostridium beijerinckii TaxID=1520 RepID=UPI00241FCFA2